MIAAKRFAVFDIDGTVIRWQLYHSIVNELSKRGFISADKSQSIKDARMTWKRRAHEESFREYERALVKAYYSSLDNISSEDLLQVVDHVFNTYKDQVYTYTRDLIRDLKSEGYLLFAISGSHHEIVEKFAQYYGFDDWVGNKHGYSNGHLAGTENTVIGKKDAHLQELIAKHGASLAGSIAVGDSESDIAMLELAKTPMAFNPTAGLFDHAKSQGWKIVVERKNVIYHLESTDGKYMLA